MTTSQVLPRSTPEAQGVSSSAIAAFVEQIKQSVDSLHSFMLLRHGTVVAETWWRPYRPESPHMLFSLSKSFTSTAVGLAAAEGRLSVDDPVLSFFPDAAPKKISANLAAMRVRHLLSMSTGHDQDTTGRLFGRRGHNPEKAFLALKVEHAPGTHFVYNSGASYMLSSIVQKLTGQTVLAYLTPRLFEPLGIQGATWESYVNGVNFGGWGLNVKTEDIARFGQLYLQKGAWNGQQILPAAWVEEATMKQVSNGDNPESDWNQGYGYQFWRCRHNIYRGDGAFGQYCIVMPEQDAVLAITSGLGDMQVPLNIVWDKLLPGLSGETAAGPAAEDLGRLLNSLALPLPQGAVTSPEAGRVSGKVYRFEPNPDKLKSLSLAFGEQSCQVTYGFPRRGGTATMALNCGYGNWVEGMMMLTSPTQPSAVPQRVVASGVWSAEDTFLITVCAYETPFVITIRCRFEGDQLFYDFKPNVGFGPTERPQLVGQA